MRLTHADWWWCCAGELERAEKRLATLAGVRPPYMDEYEALTGQLQVMRVLSLQLSKGICLHENLPQALDIKSPLYGATYMPNWLRARSQK
jgi:hypothetical protein